MKNTRKLILLALVFFAIYQIHDYSWPLLSRSEASASALRDTDSFDRIELHNDISGTVLLGTQHQVEIIAEERLLRHVRTQVHGGALRIDRATNWLLPWTRRGDVAVIITTPNVTGLQTSGASSLQMEDVVEQPELSLQSSGASELRVAVAVDELHAQSSGASDLHVRGRASHANLRSSGASDIHAGELQTATARVQASGSSDIRITVTDSVSGQLSGAADLHLGGNPTVDVNTSGSASIQMSARWVERNQ